MVYLDRVAPESQIASFAPYGSSPQNLDLVVQSVDQTADSVHVFLDVGAAHSDSEILSWVSESNKASGVDGGQFKYAFNNVVLGNHVATIVMYEPTGNFTVRRFAGLSPETQHGAGFGDTDFNGFIGPADMLGFESVLYSQNEVFNPTSDTNGDGLVDNRDLFQLEDKLLAQGASVPAIQKYDEVLLRRGNLNGDGVTNVLDMQALYADIGIPDTSSIFG